MGWEDLAGIAISAATSIYGANKAADAGKNAAAQAGAISDKQYYQSREGLAPGRNLYSFAANELGSLYGAGDRPGPWAPTIDQQGNPVNGPGNFIGNERFQNALAQFGRGGDTEVAHLTPGETVVPQRVANQPAVQNMLARGFQGAGLDPAQYTVGGPNSVNPRTGMREFADWGGADSAKGTTAERGANNSGYGNSLGDANDRGDRYDQYGRKVGGFLSGVTGIPGLSQLGGYLGRKSSVYGYNPGGGFDPGNRDGGGYGGGNALAGYATNGAMTGPQAAPNQYSSQADAIGRFYDSPDYKINFDEGAKALEHSAAARGGLFGGNTGTALVRYGQDYGNRLYHQYAGRLQSMAGLGQSAAAQTGQYGMQNAANQGNAAIAGGNAAAQGWEGIANSINSGVGNALYYNRMN